MLSGFIIVKQRILAHQIAGMKSSNLNIFFMDDYFVFEERTLGKI